ncbi:bifunctional fucokinase/fucose-1-phosphate guanylyltransferase [uncultured Sphaerochaeta sp.]|uniref:bifunctional fucokinase/fucose-1-phosphate guanylyltransferase n=1 Tax=uncultured Sphaerochaeta sp. TaxID=886478 RepID=UPI002AA8B118|nr:bifunctional fucokinase/fucose-1-phosphate guanylyltransferase [uncultured Sphaerochaeta sp.]
MDIMLSLPANAAKHFSLEKKSTNFQRLFTASDPKNQQLGSGGGTAWLLTESFRNDNTEDDFHKWLHATKKVIIHGGGLSRRLPAYAPSGKPFLPVPVFRWVRGQRLDQTLADLQVQFAEQILNNSDENQNILVASGDVLLLPSENKLVIPKADVVLFALSAAPSTASNHGVFVCDKNDSSKLINMLQKPTQQELRGINDHPFYIDTGLWLFSDKAICKLIGKCVDDFSSESFNFSIPKFYDLYGKFGLSLGAHPSIFDKEISELDVAVVVMHEQKFLHFGTSMELISSTLSIQNKELDPTRMWSKNIKPHPSIFIQNSEMQVKLQSNNHSIWIENSHIGTRWTLHDSHVITGVPENNWEIDLPSNTCIDLVPIKNSQYAIRFYGFNDNFKGNIKDLNTLFLNQPVIDWLSNHGIVTPETDIDIHDFRLFPILDIKEISGTFLQWLLEENPDSAHRQMYISSEKASAKELLDLANIPRLFDQRIQYRKRNYSTLVQNYNKSIFFQLDLRHAEKELDKSFVNNLPEIEIGESIYKQLPNDMLKYLLTTNSKYKKEAFQGLVDTILEPIKLKKVTPSCTVLEDQIVWSRSPARIDLAGGWTDTPPHCMMDGGDVVTVAIELNGQPPLQAYIRRTEEFSINLRSIDLGKQEQITTYENLINYSNLDSGFSIPKACLNLCGFHPDFSKVKYSSLQNQLRDIGCGLDITFFSAIPKGSGLGTSSLLSGTILSALSDFCGLNWDEYEICNRVLALEQLLTSGGGWQDQYGGIFPGVKLLHTEKGVNQIPLIKWLPDSLFKDPEYAGCMILFYTGITRVAKNLLGEIVEGMFLNDKNGVLALDEIKRHANYIAEVIQQGNFIAFGKAIKETWKLKNRLDSDSNNQEIQRIIDTIDDLCLGYTLPGAGGGGYLFIVAKDPQSAAEVRRRLRKYTGNARNRLVDFAISTQGNKVSRS